MVVLSSIFGFIVMLGVLIFIHEFGHFIIAKLCGVRVEVFSLGFAGKLFGFRWGETYYQIGWLPLGGYVRMLGEHTGASIPKELENRSFSHKPLWQRTLIVLAGPLANIIVLPIAALGLIYATYSTELSTVIGTVVPGRPAAMIGLRPGDRIDKVDGQKTRYFRDLLYSIGQTKKKEITIEITREGKKKSFKVQPTPYTHKDALGSPVTRKLIGITADYRTTEIGISDPNSPAYKAGLRTWDQILEVNGKKIKRWEELVRYRLKHPKGPHKYTFRRPIKYRSPTMHAYGWLPKRTVTVHPVAVPQKAGKKAPNTPTHYDGLRSSELFVEQVRPGTPLAKIGLQPGDRIIKMAGRTLKVQSDLQMLPRKKEKTYTISFVRDGVTYNKKFFLFQTIWVDPLKQKHKRTLLGFRLSQPYARGEKIGVKDRLGYAIHRASVETYEITQLMIRALKKLFTREISTSNIGGPIMIFQIAQQAVESGWEVFLRHMALISINLGLLNLLPIPILDGGHLVFFLIEAIIRRPVPPRVKESAFIVGLALLLMLMMLAFKNDIQRIFFS